MRKVVLKDKEMDEADEVASRRQNWNVDRRHKPRYGLSDNRALLTHQQGARSELAVAIAFDLPWEPFSDNPWGLPGDVDRLEVRSTTHNRGRLILHKDDLKAPKKNRPYVLVRAQPPIFRLVGWYLPSDGVEEDWWEVWRNGGGAYYVPDDELQPLSSLEKFLGV